MELKTLYDSRTSLVLIGSMKNDWDGGAKTIPETLVNKCWLICTKLKVQPSNITVTIRDTIQFEYEPKDKSYLEFEIYRNKITVLVIENEEDDRSVEFEFKANDKDSIIKDMNLLINLFLTKKFDEIRRLIGDAKK